MRQLRILGFVCFLIAVAVPAVAGSGIGSWHFGPELEPHGSSFGPEMEPDGHNPGFGPQMEPGGNSGR